REVMGTSKRIADRQNNTVSFAMAHRGGWWRTGRDGRSFCFEPTYGPYSIILGRPRNLLQMNGKGTLTVRSPRLRVEGLVGIDGPALGSGVLGHLHNDLDPAVLAQSRRQAFAVGRRPGVVVPLGTAQCGPGGPGGGGPVDRGGAVVLGRWGESRQGRRL